MSAERFAIRREDIAKLNRIAEILELEDGSDELHGEQNEWASVQRERLIAEVMHAGWGGSPALCPDGDCVRDSGHNGLHVNIAGRTVIVLGTVGTTVCT